MEKRKVSDQEFFNKAVEANAVVSEDGLTPTIYGYFAVVNVPSDETKLSTFLRTVYGEEAGSIIPPASGWYMVVKDVKDSDYAVVSKGYADEIEYAFYQKQQDYKGALERIARMEKWTLERGAV